MAILLSLAAILAAIVVCYAGVGSHAFVSIDDATYVTQNQLVQRAQTGPLLTSVVNNSYHPLTMVSLALNVARPLTARPFLLTNVLLHALDAMLVFWLAFLLARGRVLVGFVTGLLFAIHPAHVESVAWVSSRKDVLYAFFFLAGLIAYWRYLDRREWTWLAASFVAFVLACLSKGMAVVFPVLLLLLDWWKRRPLLDRRTLLEKAPFFLVALLFGLIAVDVEKGGDFHGMFRIVDKQLVATLNTSLFSPWQRILFATHGHLMYLWRLLAPVHLGVLYPYPTPEEARSPLYPLSALLFLGTIALAIGSARRVRVVAFGLGWWLIAIVPVLQWLPVGASMRADRMTYLSYVGLFFLIGYALDALWVKRRDLRIPVGIAAAAAAMILGALTAKQVGVWRDSDSLWSNVIRLYPRSDAAYVHRGNARGESGRVAEAMGDLQAAARLGSRRGDLYDGLGNAYASLGKPDSAVMMYDQALALEPTLGRTWYNLAIANIRINRPREALDDLAKALDLMPIQAYTLHFPRGNALVQLGRFREAESEFTQAIEANQLVTDAHFNRGVCRRSLGDVAGARADFQEVLRLNPTYPGAAQQLVSLGADAAAR